MESSSPPKSSGPTTPHTTQKSRNQLVVDLVATDLIYWTLTDSTL